MYGWPHVVFKEHFGQIFVHNSARKSLAGSPRPYCMSEHKIYRTWDQMCCSSYRRIKALLLSSSFSLMHYFEDTYEFIMSIIVFGFVNLC